MKQISYLKSFKIQDEDEDDQEEDEEDSQNLHLDKRKSRNYYNPKVFPIA